jgi:excinuclease ABC subunit C
LFDFQYELSKMPAMPGIYIMKDKNGKIIYVGKAKILKNRVRQYFQNQQGMQPKTRMMMSMVSCFETIVTASELEALILERNLIKKHRPQFNVVLKDDKNYPLIKITASDEFPVIMMTRKAEADGAKYFGPYTSAYAVRMTLESIGRIYPLKTCSKILGKNIKKERPCINYQIGRCLAPCQGGVRQDEYRKMIRDICLFLEGKTERIVDKLTAEMDMYSNALNFEKAGESRDKINLVKSLTDRQYISLTKTENGDFIACCSDETRVCLQIFFLRGSNITGRNTFFFNKPLEKDAGGIIADFIMQFYDSKKVIPGRIYVQEISDDADSLEKYLSDLRKKSVRIIRPIKGEKNEIMKMVRNNAKIEFDKNINTAIERESFFEDARRAVKEYLLIDNFNRLEAFDISNTSKDDIVSAMIVFDKDSFDKNSYRRYTIRGSYGINDYKALEETVKRRYGKYSIPDASLPPLPDAVLVDGALGHVNIAAGVLHAVGLDINVIGMVKDDRHHTKGLVYAGDYYDLKNEPMILRFFTMMQNEVHRFASEYNRTKRKKRIISSELDSIPGIGETRKKKLLLRFGSLKKIKEATEQEFADALGISAEYASKIRKGFDW